MATQLDVSTLRLYLRSGHIVDTVFDSVDEIDHMLVAETVIGTKVMIPIDEVVMFEGVEGGKDCCLA